MKATEILKNIKTFLGEETIEETPVELQEEVRGSKSRVSTS